ncbi:MAG TPA: transcriptional repressor [Kofleriaceae bacterium]
MVIKPKLDELRSLVRARGLRATPSRIATLELMRATEQPMSHADVADRLVAKGWDQATLYRNLMDFVEVGLLRRTDMGDHVWRFELVRDEHRQDAHPHFLCTECGTVACLPEMEFVVPRSPTPKAVKQRKIEVQMRGLCDTCS